MAKAKKYDKTKVVKFKGTLNRIFFPKTQRLTKENNCFGICAWKVNSIISGKEYLNIDEQWGTVTVKGNYTSMIVDRKEYTIVAVAEKPDKFGKISYNLLSYTDYMPIESIEDQYVFFSAILTKLQVESLFATFENPMEIVLNCDIESLCKVKGIGVVTAKKIIERVNANYEKGEMFVALKDYDFTQNFIDNLLEHYKSPKKVIDVIKNNPYKLVYEIGGIGFSTADEIARKSGISEYSPERLKAFICYLLETQAKAGNSYLLSAQLNYETYNFFGGRENIVEVYYDENGNKTGTNFKVAIDELIEEDKIKMIDNGTGNSNRKICLTKYYNLEKAIANELKRIAGAKSRVTPIDFNTGIEIAEKKQGFKFAEEQLKGIRLGIDNSLVYITGGAGCGKSSLVNGILNCYPFADFVQTALSGKASANLQEITDSEGFTIHRLLEYNPTKGFIRNSENPLEQDIIVIDEISLVGGEIFLPFLKAIRTGTKLIILGDKNQLESIGAMNIAKDMLDSKYIKSILLTEIHRQAKRSGIIVSAMKINNMETLFSHNYVGYQTFGELQDMHFDVHGDRSLSKTKAMEHFTRYLNECNDVMQIQIIGTTRERGDSSVLELNKSAQEIANPPSKDKKEVTIYLSSDKTFVLREGDKVLCQKNNYKLTNENEVEIPIFNGWTGIIKEINYNYILVYFPMAKSTIEIPSDQVRETITLGYASTAHKCQGMTIPYVVGVLDNNTPPMMQTKEMVYTVITRAKKDCTYVVQNSTLHNATKTSGVSTKQTFLQEMLDWGAYDEDDEDEFNY